MEAITERNRQLQLGLRAQNSSDDSKNKAGWATPLIKNFNISVPQADMQLNVFEPTFNNLSQ